MELQILDVVEHRQQKVVPTKHEELAAAPHRLELSPIQSFTESGGVKKLFHGSELKDNPLLPVGIKFRPQYSS